MNYKPNWFDTLNQSLDSEDLADSWDCLWAPIRYGETRSYHFDNGTKHGHQVSISRETDGRYERPVHYNC
jgi:hypothetical protein